MEIVAASRRLAGSLLAATLPRLWSHVQAVAAKAERVGAVLAESDRRTLVAAAWLHDVGYAPSIVDVGFHPLDGARWLRGHGFDDRVAALVAHHSCALVEAEERGLADALAGKFEREESATSDALWYCDLTTGPDGQDLQLVDRLNEVRARYGPDDIVTCFVNQAESQLAAAVHRTEQRLAHLARSYPM